ncbi:MAG: HD domain-containing protein [Mariprofundales bacterium]
MLVTVLARKLSIPKDDIIKLQIAAISHDIGRVGNCANAHHGLDGIDRLESLGIILDSESRSIIDKHCRADSKSNGDRLAMILKDADALDRVRTSDLNLSKLRFAESREMVSLAKGLLSLVIITD